MEGTHHEVSGGRLRGDRCWHAEQARYAPATLTAASGRAVAEGDRRERSGPVKHLSHGAGELRSHQVVGTWIIGNTAVICDLSHRSLGCRSGPTVSINQPVQMSAQVKPP